MSFISLRKYVISVKPDLLHLHSSKAGLIGRLVAFSCSIPAVYTIHGWGFGPGRRFYISIFVRFTEWLCKHITSQYIAVSNADKFLGIQKLQISKNKITTIYNATTFNTSSGSTKKDCLSLIMVARNDHQKDYDTLFKALSLAKFDKAIIVGLGTLKPDFIKRALSLAGENGHKIVFMGVRQDVEYLLERASVMVLSSRFEGMPISIIEAMSKGLAILASNVGGIPELVENGNNGLLFTSGDEVELAKQISFLYYNPGKRKKMGEASIERFKHHFDMTSMIDKTIAQYKLFLKKKSKGIN
jgi:glycosyltransferase involved in cell wall biosynthesis